MGNEKLYLGYDEEFLVDDKIKELVSLPTLSQRQNADLAPVSGNNNGVVNYLNYSLQLSKSRKFPFFTATNIDGPLFKKGDRDSWKRDDRVKNYQWGSELYSANKSDFDKGHMTKREDVQWGETEGLAQVAASSTFFYSNAVPQHKDLNQRTWRKLEDYILHTETRKRSLRICVFTGPVLSAGDPLFVSRVNNEDVQLPIVFWKIVVFPKDDGTVYRVGFLMSQRQLLIKHGLVVVDELEGGTDNEEVFMQFDDAETYQVNIATIEELTEIRMPGAIDSYLDDRPTQLILKEVEIDPELESDSIEQTLGFSIPNLVL
jgi:endonuclease G